MYIPYSGKFLRHKIFADHVVGSVSRIKEFLLATPFTVSHLAEPNFRSSKSLREKCEKIMRLENLALYGTSCMMLAEIYMYIHAHACVDVHTFVIYTYVDSMCNGFQEYVQYNTRVCNIHI